MYLAYYTQPDITFVVNFLTRYNFSPTIRYWIRINHMFCYLKDTMNINLFYSNISKSYLIGYINTNYLTDSRNDQSLIRYLFTCGDIIS